MKLSLWFYCTASQIAALGFFCLFSSPAVPAGTVSGDSVRGRGGKANVLRPFSVALLYRFPNHSFGIFLFALLACGSCRNRFGIQRPRPRWESECAQAVFCGFIVPLPKSQLWDFSVCSPRLRFLPESFRDTASAAPVGKRMCSGCFLWFYCTASPTVALVFFWMGFCASGIGLGEEIMRNFTECFCWHSFSWWKIYRECFAAKIAKVA